MTPTSTLPDSLRSEPLTDIAKCPICVDLDGTLLKTDTLYESLLRLLSKKPLALVNLPFWMAQGRAKLKHEIEKHARLDAASLPMNQDLLDYLRGQQALGRPIFLYSAADSSIVQRVADHFGIFSGCRGSTRAINLKGSQKLSAIRDDLGDQFVYAGDSRADLPIWTSARAAILIGGAVRLTKLLPSGLPIEASFPGSPAGWRDWMAALRCHQWVKNFLIFAPALLSGAVPSLETAAVLALGFAVFCLISSSTYIINDLLDLESDRAHPYKRNRPFAAGTLSIHTGVVISLALMAASTLALFLMPVLFSLAAIAYLGLTLAYSAGLKRRAPFDVVALACLFTLRIFAGMAFTTEPVSPWFLTFSLFFFLGLAFVKRYTELAKAAGNGQAELAHRGYQTTDLPIVASSGAASSLGSLLVFVTYLVNEKFPQDVYADPMWLWFIVPVLLCWTLRMWFIAIRGEMHDDPIVFSLKDRVSWFFVFLSCVFIGLSW